MTEAGGVAPGYGPRHWLLATLLALLAGYVDAIGYLTAGGYFVSFMSGNSTRMAVAAAGIEASPWPPAALIAAFLAGVVAATLLASHAGRNRKAAVLILVSLLLAAAAALRGEGPALFVALCLAAAMGAENGVFQQQGEVSIGVTYMTGALVRLGQRIAAALTGGPRWAWIPLLLLWCGLVAGAVLGAGLYSQGWSLWAAAGAAALLALAARRIVPLPV
ncbi:hypothetical protein GCM10011380_27520 [Sphingomonas metalli]|uniref:DUF1275 domain-containing protein n=1 Tax=Sphingomonas metalli TaxID=1779358 RepID=A0A916WX22_9SPHN|nr:YoaK family protein [Sphingomonas metalli]GGB36621.1 hypothetical protein GCM10011380_27520 [Sphingomonas metalli]